MNALPLGTRIWSFVPDSLLCHACSVLQNTCHFLFTCPLAQQIWSDFSILFQLPHAISLEQALFSWSAGGSRFLGREFGFRLQAGHAVALHTLWTAHTQAVYGETPTSCQGISHRFRYLLRKHFCTLSASRHFSCRLGSLPPSLL